MDQILVTAEEAANRLSVSRSMVYALMKSGALKWVKIGGSRRIRVVDLEKFVESMARHDH